MQETNQFPSRVIFAEGNLDFNAEGTFPEKAGRTASIDLIVQYRL